MTDMLEAGMTRMMQRLLQYAGRTVTYKRGPACHPIVMHKRQQQPQLIPDGDGFIKVILVDFLVNPTKDDFAAIGGEPKTGDTIEVDGARYLVTPGPSGKEFRQLADNLMRIHTKRTR